MIASDNKKITLIIITLSSFLTPYMGSSINVALPSIGKEFQMDTILLSWVASAYLLSSAMFLVPFGRIADIYGRKRIFKYGILIFTISSFLSGISLCSEMLIGIRVLQGIGGSMIFGTGIAILTSVFPVGERGKVLGINVATVYAGLSLGPVLGGFLTHHLGWRSVFFTNVPIGILVISLVFWKLKEDWVEARGEKFDFIGSLIYSVTLISIMLGFSQLPETFGGILIFVGIIAFIFFLVWENKIESPVLNIKLLKENSVFKFSNLSALINYSATFAVTFLLSLYLQYIKKLSPDEAGMILVFQPAVMSFFSPFVGRLSDKIEPRILSSIGMALTVIGLFLLSFLSSNTSLEFIIVGLVILGLGFALFSSPNTNAVMSSVDRHFYGVASGTLATMRLTGQMFSMGIATLIFAIYIGRVQISNVNYDLFIASERTAFLFFSFLCFLGIFASLARGNVRYNN